MENLGADVSLCVVLYERGRAMVWLVAPGLDEEGRKKKGPMSPGPTSIY